MNDRAGGNPTGDDSHPSPALWPDSCAAVLRVRSQADLITVLPYLLGFHPEHSLVLLCQTGQPRRHQTCVLRFDLPEPSTTGAMLDCVAETVSRAGMDTAWVVVYAAAGALPGDGTPLVAGLSARLAARGITVDEAIRVHDQRWWGYLCQRDGCCDDGHPIPPPDQPGGSSLIAAQVIAQGRAALPSRTHLAAAVAPADPGVLDDVEDAVQQLVDALTGRDGRGVDGWLELQAEASRQLEELLTATGSGRPELTAQQAATLLVALLDPQLRDQCLSWVDGDRGNRAGLVWLQLVRMAPPPLGACPATLLAYLIWQHGGGVLVSLALDQALRHDPNYRLAYLLRAAIAGGMDPTGLSPARWQDDRPNRP